MYMETPILSQRRTQIVRHRWGIKTQFGVLMHRELPWGGPHTLALTKLSPRLTHGLPRHYALGKAYAQRGEPGMCGTGGALRPNYVRIRGGLPRNDPPAVLHEVHAAVREMHQDTIHALVLMELRTHRRIRESEQRRAGEKRRPTHTPT